MKIRTGLVSNSSSSFYFCFKGKGDVEALKKQLSELILKHRDHFALSYEDYSCNALDIVSTVESHVKKRRTDMNANDWDEGYVTSLDDLIKNHEGTVNHYVSNIRKQEFKEQVVKERHPFNDRLYEKRRLKEEIKTLEKLAELKAKNMTTVVQLEFGDNGGIQGNVGRAMDYEFRSFEEEDLVVMRESNH